MPTRCLTPLGLRDQPLHHSQSPGRPRPRQLRCSCWGGRGRVIGRLPSPATGLVYYIIREGKQQDWTHNFIGWEVEHTVVFMYCMSLYELLVLFAGYCRYRAGCGPRFYRRRPCREVLVLAQPACTVDGVMVTRICGHFIITLYIIHFCCDPTRAHALY